MNANIFINEAINNGIINYLNKQNNDDITTNFIKILINIYGDLDIINPYKTNNENGMGGFDENICKFGYSKESVSLFKKNILEFYLSRDRKPNKYYNEVLKQLIDMFILKTKSIDKDKIDYTSFENMIFMDSNGYTIDDKEIKKYYSFKKKQLDFDVTYTLKDNNLLSNEAYQMVGYSYDNVKNMPEDKIQEINTQVFNYFNIDSTKDDKYLRVDQAVEYYKEYPKEEVKKEENGYVEFLLISGFISITLLVIGLLVGVILR